MDLADLGGGGDEVEPFSAMIGVAGLIAACWPVKSRSTRLRYLFAIVLVALVGIGFQYVDYEDAGFWEQSRADSEFLQMMVMVGPGGVVALLRLLGNAFSSE
ncbi:hypothetical protein [Streptomyces sp. NPDC048603]|uniref:hypothetical protein n=1 Tax=Streptomyces sp. NPDC048603 TaxID=3365577 RepID=UPI0037194685